MHAPAFPAELRRLWEAGDRGAAIRAALESWERLADHAPDLAWLQAALRSCGLEAEAFAVQAWIVRKRGQATEWERFIASVLRTGDPWWAKELLAESGTTTRELQALRIQAELGTGGDASDLIAAWARSHGDEAGLEAAVGWSIEQGDVATAERLLERASGLPLWRARLALWHAQPQRARDLLEQAPASAERGCLEAIADVLEGRLDRAETALRDLMASDARTEASCWLPTVLRKQGRYAEAAQAADVATAVSPRFNLVVRLERELALELARVAERGRGMSRWLPWRFRRRRLRKISQLEHATAVYPLGLKPQDPVLALERTLERFAGNHTVHPTITDAGNLLAYRLPPDPRYAGANILNVLWTRGPEAARSLFRQMDDALEGHPLLRIYQGELELWMGEYETAEILFREILSSDRRTLWAWIGLGAALMLQGKLESAQRIWSEGLEITKFAGPTLYVYRGECYRRQGKVELARKDLQTAVRDKPERISAWVNLALLDLQPETLQRAHAECTAAFPLLMEHLSGTVAEQLEGVLTAMRGNRRSSPSHVSYHLWGRVWRGQGVTG